MSDLSRAERHRRQEQLETGLTSLMDDLCHDWPESEQLLAREHTEHDEFGLALELLAATIVRHRKPLSKVQLSQIDSLAEKMGMVDSEYLRDLHAYAAKLGLK